MFLKRPLNGRNRTFAVDEYLHSVIRGERNGVAASLLRGGLWAASVPYGVAVQCRNAMYDFGWLRRHTANIPVISIGNLTAGGTGKTPCVEYVARRFRQWDARVVILSRGYGGEEGRNDEAMVLEENLPDVPHLQGRDRAELTRIAEVELESEVAVLDDGMQHRRLHRDVEIVLIDATNPWGYGHLLPRGLMREPARNLKRAHAVVLTRCDQVDQPTLQNLRRSVARYACETLMLESRHEPTALVNAEEESDDVQSLADRPVAAFCGIGNPSAFRQTLEQCKASIADFRVFPDHHRYSREDIEDLRRWARRQAKDCVLVTTQKDLVKVRLSRLGERPLWALRVQLTMTGDREELDRKLKEALA